MDEELRLIACAVRCAVEAVDLQRRAEAGAANAQELLLLAGLKEDHMEEALSQAAASSRP